MQINSIILKTRAEGPGLRACIWVQGCKHGCKGCFAKHLWSPKGGQTMTVQEVIDEINKVIGEIEGVTFLGGEPMDQAQELWQVAEYVKTAGKNVITFTGYTYEQIKEENQTGINKLLEYTDLLADGPFVEELLSYDRPLLGSSNQRFIFLSQEISPDSIENYKNSFELRINKEGKAVINGMGNLQKLENYLKNIDGGHYEITNL